MGFAAVLSRACADAAAPSPAPVSRDAARTGAHRELIDPAYQRHQPSLFQQVRDAVLRWLGDLLDRVTGFTPGGLLGLIVLVGLLVAAVVAIRVRLGPVALRDLFAGADGGSDLRAANDWRAEAETFAAAGRYAEAVRARMRALVRGLEERGVIDPRPGRTAAEVARDAARAAPSVAANVAAAARGFEEIWYGGQTADATSYRTVVDLDERVSATRLDRSIDAAGAAVPR